MLKINNNGRSGVSVSFCDVICECIKTFSDGKRGTQKRLYKKGKRNGNNARLALFFNQKNMRAFFAPIIRLNQ